MKKSLNNKAFVNFSSLSSERGFNLIEVLVAMMLYVETLGLSTVFLEEFCTESLTVSMS